MMAADLHQAQLVLPPSSSMFVPGPRSRSSSENDRSPQENRRRSGSSSPSMSGSGPSTPSGSEVATTESSYEDDEYIAELTRQMAHRMLQEDDDDDVKHSVLSPAWGLAGSPPSTLWSPFAANQSIKNLSCPESDRAWDISHDLSHQFEKMMSFDEQEPQNRDFHQNFYDPAPLDHSISVRPSSQALSNGGITANEFDRVQPERVAKQSRSKNRKKRGGNGGTATASTAPPPSATTHRQAQRQALRRAGSGMRAVFLGGSGPGNGSSGTGVFLPRGAGNDPSESRKKPRCSTVLIPARVAHALMVHYDKMGAQSRPGVSYFHPQHDAATSGSSTDSNLQQERQSETAPALNQSDVDLPQEWIY
ncbi:hypothetical protein NL676_005943 [Syzygium grande]|nr:hypothetical protein NL676_005943 [Syzygium grande]